MGRHAGCCLTRTRGTAGPEASTLNRYMIVSYTIGAESFPAVARTETRTLDMKPTHFAKFVLGAGLAFAATGCSENNDSAQLSQANAPQIAASAMAAMYLSLDGLNHDGIDLSGGILSPAMAAMAPDAKIAAFNAPDTCPSFTPDPPTDSDSDGVPDNALFTFDPQYCTITDQSGTMVITGSVRISDPASVAIGFDIDYTQVTFAQFETGATEPALALVFDGTRSLRGQSTSLTVDENFSVFAQVAAQQAGFSNVASLAFTPTGGATIDFDQDLPSGDVDWNGTFSAQSPEGFFVLQVTTVQTLSFDATCPSPESDEGSIVGGVLLLAAASSEGAAAVQITFNGCGVDPDVVFVGGTT